MKLWKKAAFITVGIMFLLAGFVMFALPGIVKSQAVQRVEAATGRTLVIGGISINPFILTIEIRDLRFTEPGGKETFAAFSRARIAVSPLSLYRRAPIISSARITSPHLRIVRVGANSYNFSDLLKWLPLHPRLSLNNLAITNGSVDFIDHGHSVEKRHELRKVELTIPFVTTIPYLADRYIAPRLSAVVNGSPLHLEGKLRPFPRAVEASAVIAFEDVSLPTYLAYIPVALPVRIESGRVSAKVAVTYRATKTEAPDVALDGSISLAGMKVADRAGAPFMALTRLDAVITRARLLAGEFDLSSLYADGLEVFLSRDKQGVWSHSRLVGAASPGAAPRRKMRVSVLDTRLRNGRFHFFDNLPPSRFSTNLEGISLDMRGYSTVPDKRANYALSFSTLRGEKGRLNGEFSPLPLATSSSIELTGVNIEAYYPYFASFLRSRVKGRLDVAAHLDFGRPYGLRLEKLSVQVRQLSAPFGKGEGIALQRIPRTGFGAHLPRSLNMTVAAGKVDARFAASLALIRGRLTGTFGGSTGIRSLSCLGGEGNALLKWESLQLDKIKGHLNPFALDIGDVALTRFFSRIIVEKNGTLNLQHLYTREPERAKKETEPSRKERAIRIGTVTMHGGTLVFTDHHVTGGYTTTLANLGGRISGLSSEVNRFADLDLRGNLENQSPLRITGRINPLRDDLYANLKVSFTGIELSRMTPYSGTYLGYAVDKGQLFIESNYLIENKRLDSVNKVFIDQLNLGRRIESDKATSLPVQLAVALLKDRKGEIHLDLPVAGRTDDPQFSVWRVARDALKNVIITAANSPFALLQSMFGGKEELSSVSFAYGSAELSTGQREKLLKLATALADRPALKIDVAGFVDRERDDEGYRSELLLQKMRAEKFLVMVKEKKNQPGDSPDTVQIAPEESARYLKVVYDKEEFPKPRNIFGRIKELSDAEMKKLILANTVVGDLQFRTLAEARAAGVRAFLVTQGKMDAARVSLKNSDIYRAPAQGGEPGSRVEFEVAAQ